MGGSTNKRVERLYGEIAEMLGGAGGTEAGEDLETLARGLRARKLDGVCREYLEATFARRLIRMTDAGGRALGGAVVPLPLQC